MLSLNILSLLPVALLLFLVSLIIVMVTSAWFTRRLESLCEMFGLSIGMLSLLSAIGANIPNYVASAVAIIREKNHPFLFSSLATQHILFTILPIHHHCGERDEYPSPNSTATTG